MTQIAEGLRQLHDAKIIRRELSPESIVLPAAGPSVVLTDFELAKLLDGNPTVSEDWPVDLYRAPEVQTGEVDVRADFYSWGRIFVHAALGRLPPPGKDAEAVRMTALPKRVLRLLLRCLSRPRSRRPENAEVVLRSVRNWN
jgi:serine/threonine protein kinase